ncbi:hypothetical protein D3C75_906000 [compost metagenome]
MLGAGQEAAQRPVDAFVEQPTKAQQHVLRASRAHALLDAPQCLATQAQRYRLVLFAVGRGPRTIEHAVAGRLHQGDLVVLAQLRQPLHSPLLLGQALLTDRLGLKPVEVIGQVDQGIGTMIVEQLGEAGRRPAVLGRARRQECDVLLGPKTNQRLPEGIATTQQH